MGLITFVLGEKVFCPNCYDSMRVRIHTNDFGSEYMVGKIGWVFIPSKKRVRPWWLPTTPGNLRIAYVSAGYWVCSKCVEELPYTRMEKPPRIDRESYLAKRKSLRTISIARAVNPVSLDPTAVAIASTVSSISSRTRSTVEKIIAGQMPTRRG